MVSAVTAASSWDTTVRSLTTPSGDFEARLGSRTIAKKISIWGEDGVFLQKEFARETHEIRENFAYFVYFAGPLFSKINLGNLTKE